MKLTNHHKSSITTKIMDLKIKPLKQKYEEDSIKACQKYIEETLQPHAKFISSAPDGFLYTARSFQMHFGEGLGEYVSVTLKDPVVIPYKWALDDPSRYATTVRVDKNSPLIKVFKELHKRYKDIDEYVINLRQELRSVLAGCNTSAQLLKVFPEITEYINVEEYKIYPIVVQTTKLKQLLKEG